MESGDSDSWTPEKQGTQATCSAPNGKCGPNANRQLGRPIPICFEDHGQNAQNHEDMIARFVRVSVSRKD